MLKILFITLLTALIGPAFGSAFMNHEKFVHLSRADQEKIVIATMELVVAMEAKYRKEVAASGFDAERFRKYSEFMRKVSNLLIPEAHAVRNVRYGQYLNQLRAITSGNGNCIYGGWISSMVRQGNENVCTHPNFGRFSNLYESEGCPGGRSQITCNPAIFGFKNVERKSLFCVPAGTQNRDADNSSRDCMMKSLGMIQESGASSREERINNMIAGIAANPNDANAVFDFIVRSCACLNPAQANTQIARNYSEYMIPHQTCYGILRMLSEVLPQCQVPSQPMDRNQLTFLNFIKNSLTDEQIRTNIDRNRPNEANVKTFYMGAISRLRQENADFRNAETAICGAPQTGGEGTADQCPEDRRRENNLPCCEANQVASPDKRTCTERPDSAVTVETDTPQTCPPGTTGTPPNCSPAGGGPGGGGPGPSTDGGDNVTTVDEIVVTARRCKTATNEEEWIREGDDSECVAVCAPNTQRNRQTWECDPCGANKVYNAQTRSCDDPAAETCPDNRKKENGECCPAEQIVSSEDRNQCVAPPATTTTSLSVTGAPKDATHHKVTGTISGDVTRSEYTILWYHKSTTTIGDSQFIGERNPPETPRTNLSNVGAEESEETPPPAAPPTLSTGQTRINISGAVDEFDAPRLPADYEVCGRLLKNNVKVGEDSCTKIPKKDVPRTPGNMNPFMQQQMMPTRGGSSDAIFRGVR